MYPVPGTNRLTTRMGTLVVPGQGYPGTGTGVASVSSTSTTCWAYASDMPRIVMSKPRVFPTADGLGEISAAAMDFTINDAIYRAERTVAAFWDGKVKAGVLVNLASE